jgi:hypothetical protein
VTVAQVRAIFTALLQTPMPSPEQIVAVINRTLRRTEEARIYHWHTATGTFPPRRPKLGRRPTRKKQE